MWVGEFVSGDNGVGHGQDVKNNLGNLGNY